MFNSKFTFDGVFSSDGIANVEKRGIDGDMGLWKRICYYRFDVFRPNKHFFSHVRTFSCIPVLNLY